MKHFEALVYFVCSTRMKGIYRLGLLSVADGVMEGVQALHGGGDDGNVEYNK